LLPVAAIIAALSTLACCLPFGFLAAIGIAGVSIWLQAAPPWLLGTAVVRLALGFVQLYVGRSQCKKRSPISVALFWIAVTVVILIITLSAAS